MYAGKLVEKASAAEITEDPRHPYTQLLLALAARGRCALRGEAADGHPRPARRRSSTRRPAAGSAPAARSRSRSAPRSRRSSRSRRDGSPPAGRRPPDAASSTASRRSSRPACSAKAELTAVSDVSFAVQPGEVVSLIGESGSGKTTVGRMILRLTGATSRHDHVRRQRRVERSDGASLRRYYGARAGRLPGPVQLVQPGLQGRPRARHDPVELPARAERERLEGAAAQVARGRLARAGGRARQVPAPAQRRAASAPDDRPRAAARHQVPRRRRDHQHARRVDPDRRAQPARRPEGAGRRDPLHHARPLARQLHLRPDR